MSQLNRIRWGIRSVLVLGVAASTVANVLHARENPISQAIAAWPPLALLITIEVISRVPVRRRRLAVGRILATAVIAGIAAWVSYWHMVGVALRYGESAGAAHLIPFSVDGLIVVASICLVELGGRIREQDEAPAVQVAAVDPVLPRPAFDHPRPIGPLPAPAPSPVDSLSTPAQPIRKPQPSSEERVLKAHRRSPDATNEELAQRLNLSTKTVQRYRPKRVEEPRINGHVPVLEEASR